MDIKDQVLQALEKNKGRYISGNELAEMLYVSRNAVWKAVKALESEGHSIQAVTNKGYCLAADSDILTAASIAKHLGALETLFDVEVFKTLTSTNTVLKERASKGAREGTVIIAEEQTGGRGRMGRSFLSPSGTGIYFSLLLRPSVTASDATLITTAAAVAVASSIETVTGVESKIKWVNDVFCRGKKVCGILTEGSFDMETGGMEYVVLGIGVNVTSPETGFPGISQAGAVLESGQQPETETQSRLIAEILRSFWGFYEKLADKVYLSDYKERSLIIGHDVDVVTGSVTKKARVLDIDNDCHLIIRYEDGTIKALSSGEVSIRPFVS